jgi:hypothetical protein
MKGYEDSFLRVMLYKWDSEGKRSRKAIYPHLYLATRFLPNPQKHKYATLIDMSDYTKCGMDNLKWISASELRISHLDRDVTIRYRLRNKMINSGFYKRQKAKKYKFTMIEQNLMRRLRKAGLSYKAIARRMDYPYWLVYQKMNTMIGYAGSNMRHMTPSTWEGVPEKIMPFNKYNAPRAVIATRLSSGKEIHYPTIGRAARNLRQDRANVKLCCDGGIAQINGFAFRYKHIRVLKIQYNKKTGTIRK